MGASGAAHIGGEGLWVPWTIVVTKGAGFDVLYTVPAGPFFALTFMEWNTSGGESSSVNVAVTDVATGVIIWERFAGADSDEIIWDGLFCIQPGHQLHIVSNSFFESRFHASGYFYSAPGSIDYAQTH